MKYLENLTDTILHAIEGRIQVARKFFIAISEAEAEHDDIVFAVRKGWAAIHDSPPDIAAPAEAPAITLTDPAKAQQVDPSELPGNKARAAAETAATNAQPAAPVEAAPAPVAETAAAPAVDAAPAVADTPAADSAPTDATATKKSTKKSAQ